MGTFKFGYYEKWKIGYLPSFSIIIHHLRVVISPRNPKVPNFLSSNQRSNQKTANNGKESYTNGK